MRDDLPQVNIDGGFESRLEGEVTEFDTASGEETVGEGGELVIGNW